jgi:hypothetical protein
MENTNEEVLATTEQLLIVGGIIIIALFTAISTTLLWRRRRKNPLFAPNASEERLKIAAEMLSNVMVHPDAWLRSKSLLRRRLLPLLGTRRAISLKNALELGNSGRLWFSEGTTDLAALAVDKGGTLLDSSNEAFRSLIVKLPGVADLDELAALRPMSPSCLTEEFGAVGGLIEQVNRVLEDAGFGKKLYRLTLEETSDEWSREVDLSGLGFRGGRFIILAADSILLEERAKLARTEPRLAVFLTLDYLLSMSDMLQLHQERIRAHAARRLICEAQ